MKSITYFIMLVFISLLCSCSSDEIEYLNGIKEAPLKSITPQYFDWETVDQMPTKSNATGVFH